MSDNLQDAATAPFALSGWRVLVISGRDALAFAQSQFMNDVATLADGQWQWNGWLTPKGRLIALFALLRIDAETLWLVLPDVDPMTLAPQLQRYVFRSKVTLSVRNDLHARGSFVPPAAASGIGVTHVDDDIELDMGGDAGPRRLCIGATAAIDDSDALARWNATDFAYGLPRLPPSQAEHWTPQQLSLDRLRAFSVKKGCYPGQEIVARTHFLGQVKRGLALFNSDAPLEAGIEVRDGERAIGSIVSVAGNSSLAVLPLERDAGAFTAEGVALREKPLLSGLAR